MAQDAPKTEPAAPAPKKGAPIKTIGIVAVLMVLEAAAVFVFIGATGPTPQSAAAHEFHGAGEPDAEATVEVPLVADRLQNMQTGRVWIWDTEIYLKVKTRNEEYVTKELARRAAEVQEGVALIFRRAPHSQLKEPGLETINRQLTAYITGAIGKDPEGHERIERVVIPKCKGFPAD